MNHDSRQLRTNLKRLTDTLVLSGELHAFIRYRAHQVDHLLPLSCENNQAHLAEFIVAYIERVPDLLEALHSITLKAKLASEFKDLLQVANSYFDSPYDRVDRGYEMNTLIDQAYLVHKLLESMNDHLFAKLGYRLLPLELSFSNSVIYELLGAEFTEDLDQAIQFVIEALFSKSLAAEKCASETLSQTQGCIDWDNFVLSWPQLEVQADALLSTQDQSPLRVIH